MVSYKELGLVNTKDMFAKAMKGGYAIPAFNFNNMEQMQAIIMACVEVKSPVILQVQRVLALMQTQTSSATWPAVQLNMHTSLAATFRSFSTLTTVQTLRLQRKIGRASCRERASAA